MLTQCIESALEIHRVPQYDREDHQVQPAGAVTLVFESSVAKFAFAVEEDCPSQRVSRLGLLEYLNVFPEFWALHPFEHEQGAFHPSNLSQCGMKAILAGIAC